MGANRRKFQEGNAKDFNVKLINAFMSIKRLEVAEKLFNLFTFHSGHAHCTPTRRWTKHILLHLNIINKFPGYPDRVELRMTSGEMEKVMQIIWSKT